MTSNRLFKNSIFYTLGNILPQAVGFILIPIYTYYLTPDQYGIVNSMSALGSVLGVLLTLGIDRGIYRLYYDYDLNERKVYLGTIIIGLSSVAALFFLISFSIPDIISAVYSSISFYPYYALMIGFTLVGKLMTVPSIYLRISEQAGKFVIINSLMFLLTAGFNLLFIIYFKEGAEGMLKGHLVSNIIMLPLFFYFTKGAYRFKFNWNYFLNSIKFSLPLVPGFIFAWVLNLSDRIFLERYLSLNEVGIYSLGSRVAGLVTVFVGGIFAAYNPHFYKLANEEGAEVKKKIGQYNHIIVLLIMNGIFLIVFFSPELITLLISEKYKDAAIIIPFLALGLFFSQITGFLNLMIYQEKKSLQIMYITFIGAIVNVLSNLFFIPLFGMLGSAFATVTSFFVLFIIEYYYAKKCFFIPFRWKIILPLFAMLSTIYILFEVFIITNIFYKLIIKTSVAVGLLFLILFKYKTQLKTLIGRT